ncbi:hypothetical protein, conserved, partial [Eimeria tenella]
MEAAHSAFAALHMRRHSLLLWLDVPCGLAAAEAAVFGAAAAAQVDVAGEMSLESLDDCVSASRCCRLLQQLLPVAAADTKLVALGAPSWLSGPPPNISGCAAPVLLQQLQQRAAAVKEEVLQQLRGGHAALAAAAAAAAGDSNHVAVPVKFDRAWEEAHCWVVAVQQLQLQLQQQQQQDPWLVREGVLNAEEWQEAQKAALSLPPFVLFAALLAASRQQHQQQHQQQQQQQQKQQQTASPGLLELTTAETAQGLETVLGLPRHLSVAAALLLDIRGEGLISYTDFRRLPSYLHAAASTAAAAAAGCAAAADAAVGGRGSACAAPWWLEALLQGPRQAAAAAAAAAALRSDVLLLLAATRRQGPLQRALLGLAAPEQIPLAAAETHKVLLRLGMRPEAARGLQLLLQAAGMSSKCRNSSSSSSSFPSLSMVQQWLHAAQQLAPLVLQDVFCCLFASQPFSSATTAGSVSDGSWGAWEGSRVAALIEAAGLSSLAASASSSPSHCSSSSSSNDSDDQVALLDPCRIRSSYRAFQQQQHELLLLLLRSLRTANLSIEAFCCKRLLRTQQQQQQRAAAAAQTPEAAAASLLCRIKYHTIPSAAAAALPAAADVSRWVFVEECSLLLLPALGSNSNGAAVAAVASALHLLFDAADPKARGSVSAAALQQLLQDAELLQLQRDSRALVALRRLEAQHSPQQQQQQQQDLTVSSGVFELAELLNESLAAKAERQQQQQQQQQRLSAAALRFHPALQRLREKMLTSSWTFADLCTHLGCSASAARSLTCSSSSSSSSRKGLSLYRTAFRRSAAVRAALVSSTAADDLFDRLAVPEEAEPRAAAARAASSSSKKQQQLQEQQERFSLPLLHVEDLLAALASQKQFWGVCSSAACRVIFLLLRQRLASIQQQQQQQEQQQRQQEGAPRTEAELLADLLVATEHASRNLPHYQQQQAAAEAAAAAAAATAAEGQALVSRLVLQQTAADIAEGLLIAADLDALADWCGKDQGLPEGVCDASMVFRAMEDAASRTSSKQQQLLQCLASEALAAAAAAQGRGFQQGARALTVGEVAAALEARGHRVFSSEFLLLLTSLLPPQQQEQQRLLFDLQQGLLYVEPLQAALQGQLSPGETAASSSSSSSNQGSSLGAATKPCAELLLQLLLLRMRAAAALHSLDAVQLFAAVCSSNTDSPTAADWHAALRASLVESGGSSCCCFCCSKSCSNNNKDCHCVESTVARLLLLVQTPQDLGELLLLQLPLLQQQLPALFLGPGSEQQHQLLQQLQQLSQQQQLQKMQQLQQQTWGRVTAREFKEFFSRGGIGAAAELWLLLLQQQQQQREEERADEQE